MLKKNLDIIANEMIYYRQIFLSNFIDTYFQKSAINTHIFKSTLKFHFMDLIKIWFHMLKLHIQNLPILKLNYILFSLFYIEFWCYYCFYLFWASFDGYTKHCYKIEVKKLKTFAALKVKYNSKKTFKQNKMEEQTNYESFTFYLNLFL